MKIIAFGAGHATFRSSTSPQTRASFTPSRRGRHFDGDGRSATGRSRRPCTTSRRHVQGRVPEPRVLEEEGWRMSASTAGMSISPSRACRTTTPTSSCARRRAKRRSSTHPRPSRSCAPPRPLASSRAPSGTRTTTSTIRAATRRSRRSTAIDVGLAHASDRGRIAGQTRFLEEGDHFSLGELGVEVLHVPGHTLGAIAYVVPVADRRRRRLHGRHDVPRRLRPSLRGDARPDARLASGASSSQGDAARVYPGHEYTLQNLRFAWIGRARERGRGEARSRRLQALRDQGQPTVGTTIGRELRRRTPSSGPARLRFAGACASVPTPTTSPRSRRSARRRTSSADAYLTLWSLSTRASAASRSRPGLAAPQELLPPGPLPVVVKRPSRIFSLFIRTLSLVGAVIWSCRVRTRTRSLRDELGFGDVWSSDGLLDLSRGASEESAPNQPRGALVPSRRPLGASGLALSLGGL